MKMDRIHELKPIVTIIGAAILEEKTWKLLKNVSSKISFAKDNPKVKSNKINDNTIEPKSKNTPANS
jgi:DUF438 domain-containing protein